jgi:hypothetical protein
LVKILGVFAIIIMAAQAFAGECFTVGDKIMAAYKADMEEAVKYAARGDHDAVVMMAKQGRVMLTPPNVRVNILQTSGGLVQVQRVGTTFKVWTATEYVRCR